MQPSSQYASYPNPYTQEPQQTFRTERIAPEPGIKNFELLLEKEPVLVDIIGEVLNKGERIFINGSTSLYLESDKFGEYLKKHNPSVSSTLRDVDFWTTLSQQDIDMQEMAQIAAKHNLDFVDNTDYFYPKIAFKRDGAIVAELMFQESIDPIIQIREAANQRHLLDWLDPLNTYLLAQSTYQEAQAIEITAGGQLYRHAASPKSTEWLRERNPDSIYSVETAIALFQNASTLNEITTAVSHLTKIKVGIFRDLNKLTEGGQFGDIGDIGEIDIPLMARSRAAELNLPETAPLEKALQQAQAYYDVNIKKYFSRSITTNPTQTVFRIIYNDNVKREFEKFIPVTELLQIPKEQRHTNPTDNAIRTLGIFIENNKVTDINELVALMAIFGGFSDSAEAAEVLDKVSWQDQVRTVHSWGSVGTFSGVYSRETVENLIDQIGTIEIPPVENEQTPEGNPRWQRQYLLSRFPIEHVEYHRKVYERLKQITGNTRISR